MTAASPTPWWLATDDEECPSCLARYAYEIELRCVHCDGPLCPLCVVRVRETAVVSCPECVAEERG